MNNMNEGLWGYKRKMDFDKIEKDKIVNFREVDKLINDIENHKYMLKSSLDSYFISIDGNGYNTNKYFNNIILYMYYGFYDLYKVVRYIYNNDNLKLRYNDKIKNYYSKFTSQIHGTKIGINRERKKIQMMIICVYLANRIDLLYYNGEFFDEQDKPKVFYINKTDTQYEFRSRIEDKTNKEVDPFNEDDWDEKDLNENIDFDDIDEEEYNNEWDEKVQKIKPGTIVIIYQTDWDKLTNYLISNGYRYVGGRKFTPVRIDDVDYYLIDIRYDKTIGYYSESEIHHVKYEYENFIDLRY